MSVKGVIATTEANVKLTASLDVAVDFDHIDAILQARKVKSFVVPL